MKKKSIMTVVGFLALSMFPLGAHANPGARAAAATRAAVVDKATNSLGSVTRSMPRTKVPKALEGLLSGNNHAAVALVSARVAASGGLEHIESISKALENVGAEDSEVEGMSKDLRIQTLVNAFAVVALTDSEKVIDFVMGKPFTAASAPGSQSAEDSLDGGSLSNFNGLLEDALKSKGDHNSTISVADMDKVIKASNKVSAKSLSEMEPCSNPGLANNR